MFVKGFFLAPLIATFAGGGLRAESDRDGALGLLVTRCEATGLAEFPPSGPSQLWLMNADGSGQHQLFTNSLDDSFPSFSPNGSHIAFTRCKTDFSQCAISRIRADGTGLTAVTDFLPDIYDIAPVYSPDGQTIPFGGFGAREKFDPADVDTLGTAGPHHDIKE